MLLDQRQRVVPGLARVNDNRLFGRGRDSHLLHERRFLNIARRKIVVIVETDFAHGEHLGMRQKIGQASEIARTRLRGIMRMNADCGVERRMLIGQPEAGFEIGRTVARPDGHHVLDAGSEGALDHRLAILVELGAVQMAMGVNEIHSCGARTPACRVHTRVNAFGSGKNVFA